MPTWLLILLALAIGAYVHARVARIIGRSAFVSNRRVAREALAKVLATMPQDALDRLADAIHDEFGNRRSPWKW